MKECEQWIHNMNLSIIEKKKKCNRRARRTEKYLLKDMQYSEKKANALGRHDIFRCRMLKNREIKELMQKTLDIQSGEEIKKIIL